MKDNGVSSLSLLDLLSASLTDKEIKEIKEIKDVDLSPEFILACCAKTKGINKATYLGGGRYELETDAGKVEIIIETKGGDG